MTTAVWSPSGVTSYDNSGAYDTAWSSATTVSIAAGHGGEIREFNSGTALEAVHDGCVVADIKVEFTGSKVSFATDVFAYAEFAGISVLTYALAASSTNYSANGGAGTLPSVVRAALLYSSCRNDDASYSASVNMSLPIVTVTYTDNGIPYMLQFSL
jgi:hypothetical protein